MTSGDNSASKVCAEDSNILLSMFLGAIGFLKSGEFKSLELC